MKFISVILLIPERIEISAVKVSSRFQFFCIFASNYEKILIHWTNKILSALALLMSLAVHLTK